MWKRIASVAAAAAVGSPVAVALAAEAQEPPASSPAAGQDFALSGERVLDQVRAKKRTHRSIQADERRDAERRRAKRRARRAGGGDSATGAQGASTASPALEAIAACESGGNPRAIGGGGQYRGKYQFTYETWAGVGGSGDPAAASEAEQDRRAAILYAQAGAGQWPTCGG